MNLPAIISSEETENGINLLLDISDSLEAFDGHFDSAPIIPGVVQIQWALAFNNQFLSKIDVSNIDRIDSLKFQQVIQPNSNVKLELDMKGKKLHFCFSSNDKRHSSGKVLIN